LKQKCALCTACTGAAKHKPCASMSRAPQKPCIKCWRSRHAWRTTLRPWNQRPALHASPCSQHPPLKPFLSLAVSVCHVSQGRHRLARPAAPRARAGAAAPPASPRTPARAAWPAAPRVAAQLRAVPCGALRPGIVCTAGVRRVRWDCSSSCARWPNPAFPLRTDFNGQPIGAEHAVWRCQSTACAAACSRPR